VRCRIETEAFANTLRDRIGSIEGAVVIDSGPAQKRSWHLDTRSEMDEQASVGGSLLPNLGVDGAKLDIALEASETKLSQENYCARRCRPMQSGFH
jgi:hypothetical protein